MADTTNPIELAGSCTGAYWSEQGIKIGFGRGADWRSVLVSTGAQIALAVEGERQCIGYRDADNKAHRCPDDAPATWVAQCERCHRRSGLKSIGSGSTPARTTAAEATRSEGPTHVVYLAAYAPGYDQKTQTQNFMKVGISQVGRVKERLSEQGAREALVIAAGSELDATRLETAICKLDHRLGIDGVKQTADRRRVKDRLNQRQHLEAWAKAPDSELMLQELERKLNELRRRLPFFASVFLSDEQVVEMELPELPPISPACKLLRARDLVLRGRVRGIYGLYLILDADTGEQVALNSRSLIGYELRSPAVEEHGQDQLALAFG